MSNLPYFWTQPYTRRFTTTIAVKALPKPHPGLAPNDEDAWKSLFISRKESTKSSSVYKACCECLEILDLSHNYDSVSSEIRIVDSVNLEFTFSFLSIAMLEKFVYHLQSEWKEKLKKGVYDYSQNL